MGVFLQSSLMSHKQPGPLQMFAGQRSFTNKILVCLVCVFATHTQPQDTNLVFFHDHYYSESRFCHIQPEHTFWRYSRHGVNIHIPAAGDSSRENGRSLLLPHGVENPKLQVGGHTHHLFGEVHRTRELSQLLLIQTQCLCQIHTVPLGEIFSSGTQDFY